MFNECCSGGVEFIHEAVSIGTRNQLYNYV